MRDMLLRLLNAPPKQEKSKMGKWLFVLLFTALGVGGLYGLSNAMYKLGQHDGMKMYHQICYQISGPMLDKEDGTVVYCMPLAAIPEEEMNKHRQQELDNKNKVWYNNT